MRVFVTGAAGFVGSAVVAELLEAGHQVTGLARSDANASALARLGATVHRGSLEDLDTLRAGSANADAVIHLAFVHDFANFLRSVEIDRDAITAIGQELAGSNRPFVVTSGVAALAQGRASTEDDVPGPGFPRKSEEAAMAFVPRDVRVSVVRLAPTTHDAGDRGFIPHLINIARDTGFAAYVGDGENRWAAVHRRDAARLFRLAVESAPAGARLHAIAEEGIAMREIAATIARHLNVPVRSITSEESEGYFGWMARFAAMDLGATSVTTREQMGWQPTHPTLLEDLNSVYFTTEPALGL